MSHVVYTDVQLYHSVCSFCLQSKSLIIILFYAKDQPLRVSVCPGEQDAGQEGVLWLDSSRYQTIQAHIDECHQEMELDVQGAPAQSCDPEVRHTYTSIKGGKSLHTTCAL